VIDGDPAPGPIRERGTAVPPLFGACLLWPNARQSEQLLSGCTSLQDIVSRGRTVLQTVAQHHIKSAYRRRSSRFDKFICRLSLVGLTLVLYTVHPIQPVEIFGNVSMPFGTFSSFDTTENFTEIVSVGVNTRSPAIAEGPRDAGVPVEIW